VCALAFIAEVVQSLQLTRPQTKIN